MKNPAGYCLDVDAKRNDHHRHLIFYICHYDQNQVWWFDTDSEPKFDKYPLEDGRPFQLRSNHGTRRALHWHKSYGWGSNQYYLRIWDHMPGDRHQWWHFDWRTKTIRADLDRNFVIGGPSGYTYYHNSVWGVVRHYNHEIQQMMVWSREHKNNNLHTPAGHCLQLNSGSDSNLNYVTFTRPCHPSYPNWSGWSIDI